MQEFWSTPVRYVRTVGESRGAKMTLWLGNDLLGDSKLIAPPFPPVLHNEQRTYCIIIGIYIMH